MPIETLLFGQRQSKTTYTPRQLRNKLAKMRAGMAQLFAKGTPVAFLGGAKLTREQILEAIDTELAAFAAFDALLITVKQRRQALAARLPLLATAIGVLTTALTAHVGGRAPIRPHLGLAPNKKPRRLKPEERLEATAKLRTTRERNQTSARQRRRRKR